MPEEEKLVSEFNEAAFQISRLHNIWLACQLLREKGRLVSLKWKLDTATTELWSDAKRIDGEQNPKEEGHYISTLKKLDDDILKSEKEKNFSKVYSQLLEKERLLREIQNAAGKGTRLRPADDDYM